MEGTNEKSDGVRRRREGGENYMIGLLSQVLEQQGHMLEQQGRMLERQEVHTNQLEKVTGKVDRLDHKVTQHRTGWQILMYIGGAGLAIFAAFQGFIRS